MISKFLRIFFSKIFNLKTPSKTSASIKSLEKKSVEKIVILEVPYAEKDQAKAQGARWNPKIKKWFIQAEADQSKFKKWLVENLELDASITLKPKIYLLHSLDKCYKCCEVTDLFCLASDGLIDHKTNSDFNMFFTIHGVTFLPEKVKDFLKKYAPTYYLDYTRQSNSSYFVNHCKCGAKLGDFFIHNEPGGAFFPISKNEAKNITIYQIHTTEPMKINSAYSTNDMNFILTNAKHGDDLDLE